MNKTRWILLAGTVFFALTLIVGTVINEKLDCLIDFYSVATEASPEDLMGPALTSPLPPHREPDPPTPSFGEDPNPEFGRLRGQIEALQVVLSVDLTYRDERTKQQLLAMIDSISEMYWRKFGASEPGHPESFTLGVIDTFRHLQKNLKLEMPD